MKTIPINGKTPVNLIIKITNKKHLNYIRDYISNVYNDNDIPNNSDITSIIIRLNYDVYNITVSPLTISNLKAYKHYSNFTILNDTYFMAIKPLTMKN